MRMKDWAQNEINIACEAEGSWWCYGCYKSALKAYESLLKDDHSGVSFNFTKNILTRLMNNLPLTPIVEEDFDESKLRTRESEAYLEDHGLKSNIQCYRMSSLFRREDLQGNVSYIDVDRAYAIDPDGHPFTGSVVKVVDEFFPITLPYYPQAQKYKIIVDEFLQDPKNGDFDHQAVLYITTPDGKRVEVNRYYKDVDGKMILITKEEYYKDKALV